MKPVKKRVGRELAFFVPQARLLVTARKCGRHDNLLSGLRSLTI